MDDRKRDAIEEQRAMAALIASPGWKVVAAHIEEQCEQRVALVLGPGDDHDGVNSEFLKGEIAAMRLIQAYPVLISESARNTIDLFENDDEEGAD